MKNIIGNDLNQFVALSSISINFYEFLNKYNFLISNFHCFLQLTVLLLFADFSGDMTCTQNFTRSLNSYG
jgi:hypothetical protein